MILRSLLVGLLATSLCAQAQQYRWVDEKGRTQFGDAPPPRAKELKKLDPKRDAPAADEAPAAPDQLPFALQRVQKDFPVKLFTAPVCKEPCERAREMLNKRGVVFEEIQVWTQESMTQLKAATSGGENVPALVVGRSSAMGYDPARYESLLDSAGYPKTGVLPPRKQEALPTPAGYPTAGAGAEPVPSAPDNAPTPGPYDASGLKSNEKPRPRLYDPSGLKSPTQPKPGPYGLPGEATK